MLAFLPAIVISRKSGQQHSKEEAGSIINGVNVVCHRQDCIIFNQPQQTVWDKRVCGHPEEVYHMILFFVSIFMHNMWAMECVRRGVNLRNITLKSPVHVMALVMFCEIKGHSDLLVMDILSWHPQVIRHEFLTWMPGDGKKSMLWWDRHPLRCTRMYPWPL